MTKVVNKRYSSYDVDIGRPSIWGNPFVIGKQANRTMVIEKYREYFLSNDALKERAKELEGKVLGCYCKPRACHGDVIVNFLKGE